MGGGRACSACFFFCFFVLLFELFLFKCSTHRLRGRGGAPGNCFFLFCLLFFYFLSLFFHFVFFSLSICLTLFLLLFVSFRLSIL